MSLGATMSAPAFASDAAVFASSGRLASFSTSPVFDTKPQCPCAVYSHRQTSAIITSESSDLLFLQRPQGRLRDAVVGIRTADPFSSFSAGNPKSNNPPNPSFAAACASFTASSTERLKTPGIDATGLRTPSPGQTNTGWISIDGIQLRLAHQRAQSFCSPQSPQPCHRKFHSPILRAVWVPAATPALASRRRRSRKVHRMLIRQRADARLP